MDRLPSEIILLILQELCPRCLQRVQGVSRRMRQLASSPELWRYFCYLNWMHGRGLARDNVRDQPHQHRYAPKQIPIPKHRSQKYGIPCKRCKMYAVVRQRHREQQMTVQDWDLTCSDEQVRWQVEYRAQHARMAVTWFAAPWLPDDDYDSQGSHHPVTRLCAGDNRPKGLGLYRTANMCRAVAPLEYGAIAIWALDGDDSVSSRSTIGSMRLPKGHLNTFPAEDPSNAFRRQSVAIDSYSSRLYWASGQSLFEIDLHTLKPISRRVFPTVIAAIDDFQPGLPLTIAWDKVVELWDPRVPFIGDDSGRTTLQDFLVERVQHTRPMPSLASNAPHRRFIRSASQCDRASFLVLRGLCLVSNLSHIAPIGTPDVRQGLILAAGHGSKVWVFDRRMYPYARELVSTQLFHITSLSPFPVGRQSPDQDNHTMCLKEAPFCDGYGIIAAGAHRRGKGGIERLAMPIAPRGAQFGDCRPLPDWLRARVPSSFRARSRCCIQVPQATQSFLDHAVVHGTQVLATDGEGAIHYFDRQRLQHCRTISLTATRPGHSSVWKSSRPPAPSNRLLRPVKLVPVDDDPGAAVLIWTLNGVGQIAPAKPKWSGGL